MELVVFENQNRRTLNITEKREPTVLRSDLKMPLPSTAGRFYCDFGSNQHCLGVAGDLNLCDQVEEPRLHSCHRVIVTDLHPGRPHAKPLEARFHPVIAEDLADTHCVLGQHCDDFLERDDYDVFLDARMPPARKMTSI